MTCIFKIIPEKYIFGSGSFMQIICKIVATNQDIVNEFYMVVATNQDIVNVFYPYRVQ